MIVDTKIGQSKRPKAGQCLICNSIDPKNHTTIGASFCDECWAVLGNEEKLSQRFIME